MMGGWGVEMEKEKVNRNRESEIGKGDRISTYLLPYLPSHLSFICSFMTTE